MKNKIKEFIKNLNTQNIISIFLLIIALLIFFENRQLHKIINQQYIITKDSIGKRINIENRDCNSGYRNRNNYISHNEEKIDLYFDTFNTNIEKELKSMKKDIENNVNSFNIKNDNFKKNNKFTFYPKIEEKNNNIIFKMKLPRNIKRDDIVINLQNNNLIIKIEKNIENNKDNSYFHSYFLKSFQVKDTKATNNDLKINLNRNELVIVVPIIE